MGDGPAAHAAVEEHASEGLVTRLTAVTRPAPDVQAPAKNEAGLQAMLALGRLEGAVLCFHDREHKVWIASSGNLEVKDMSG